MEGVANKAHRTSKSGAKAEKKNPNKKNNGGKGFAFNSGARAERAGRRNMDLDQHKLHVPLVDRTSQIDSPPIVVAVVGPRGVGKTSLIRSLVKKFTKHNLQEINGPITVVSSKSRRITFFEASSDLNSMIDIGKIADLILLMVDASFGFEMVLFGWS